MRVSPILALLSLLLSGLFGCALPKVEPGSVMLAVLSDPPGARVYRGHETTSSLLGTTPFTVIWKVPPEARGKVLTERITAVWSSGATSKRSFNWQPDGGQHHKFVFDLPPDVVVQDLEFGLRHLATLGKTTPAMQAHSAHFGWERTKQMYSDWLSLSAEMLAAKYGSRAPGGASSEWVLPSLANRQAPPAPSGYQTRDSFGNLVNSRDSFQTRDSFGNLVNSGDSYQTRDSFGNLVNSKDCFQTQDSFGNLVKSAGC